MKYWPHWVYLSRTKDGDVVGNDSNHIRSDVLPSHPFLPVTWNELED